MTVDVDIRRPDAVLGPLSLTRLVRRPLGHPALALVEQRRAELAETPAYAAHEIYGAPHRTLRPEDISLPVKYGHVIYSLASHAKPRLAVESGAGFGVSGMYILCALAAREGRLASFEIGDYWREAEKSHALVGGTNSVANRPFEDFPQMLDPGARIDFAFVDAVHEKDVVIRSVRTLIGWMRPGGLIVLDDLQANDSMREAWPLVARHPFISLAARVNGRLGVLEVRQVQ